METTEKIVEAYVRHVKRWATIPNPPKTRPPAKKTKAKAKPEPKLTESDQLRRIWDEDLCE